MNFENDSSGHTVAESRGSDCGCGCSGGGCGCGGTCGFKSNDDDFYGLNGRDQESMWDGPSMRASSFGQSHPPKPKAPTNFDDQFAGTFVELTGTANPHRSTQFSGDILGLCRSDADSSIWDGTSSRIAGFMPGHQPAGEAQSVRRQTDGISSLGHDFVVGGEPMFDQASLRASQVHARGFGFGPDTNFGGLPTIGVGSESDRFYAGAGPVGSKPFAIGRNVPLIIRRPNGPGWNGGGDLCQAYRDCIADSGRMAGTTAQFHILARCNDLLERARDMGLNCQVPQQHPCQVKIICDSVSFAPMFGVHCWFEVVLCTGVHKRWEVWQDPAPAQAPYGGTHLHENRRPFGAGISTAWYDEAIEFAFSWLADTREPFILFEKGYPCVDGNGDPVPNPCDCMETEVPAYPWKDEYALVPGLTGEHPNSNTFVGFIAERCGIRRDDGEKLNKGTRFVGWDYRGPLPSGPDRYWSREVELLHLRHLWWK